MSSEETLGGRVRHGGAAKDELRLARRLEDPRAMQTEGGADFLAGKGAETRLAEIAVITCCPVSLAHI